MTVLIITIFGVLLSVFCISYPKILILNAVVLYERHVKTIPYNYANKVN